MWLPAGLVVLGSFLGLAAVGIEVTRGDGHVIVNGRVLDDIEGAKIRAEAMQEVAAAEAQSHAGGDEIIDTRRTVATLPNLDGAARFARKRVSVASADLTNGQVIMNGKVVDSQVGAAIQAEAMQEVAAAEVHANKGRGVRHAARRNVRHPRFAVSRETDDSYADPELARRQEDGNEEDTTEDIGANAAVPTAQQGRRSSGKLRFKHESAPLRTRKGTGGGVAGDDDEDRESDEQDDDQEDQNQKPVPSQGESAKRPLGAARTHQSASQTVHGEPHFKAVDTAPIHALLHRLIRHYDQGSTPRVGGLMRSVEKLISNPEAMRFAHMKPLWGGDGGTGADPGAIAGENGVINCKNMRGVEVRGFDVAMNSTIDALKLNPAAAKHLIHLNDGTQTSQEAKVSPQFFAKMKKQYEREGCDANYVHTMSRLFGVILNMVGENPIQALPRFAAHPLEVPLDNTDGGSDTAVPEASPEVSTEDKRVSSRASSRAKGYATPQHVQVRAAPDITDLIAGTDGGSDATVLDAYAE